VTPVVTPLKAKAKSHPKPKPVKRKPPAKSKPKKHALFTAADRARAKEVHPKEKTPVPSLKNTHVPTGQLTGGPHVRIQAWQLAIEIKAMLGENGAKLTGGFGQWDEVSVPRGDPFTVWKGRSLLAMDLDIIINGWGVSPHSVEPGIKNLETLATRISGTLEPQPIRLFGAVPHTNLPWVITSLDWGDAIRDSASGVRFRQQVTLKLLEYRAETTVANLPRATAQPKKVTKYKVKKGDDLKKIAAKLLHASGKWQLIEKANKGMRGFKLDKKWIGKTIKIPTVAKPKPKPKAKGKPKTTKKSGAN
jgi:hypothetical protein